jgi:hypothetical protein
MFLLTFLLFCTPVFLLAHHHLHIYHSSVNLLNCNYFATMAYLLPYLRTPFAHTVYRFFYCVIDCMFVYPTCNSVLFVVHCFALSWPGCSCKSELVLNWPTWLKQSWFLPGYKLLRAEILLKKWSVISGDRSQL